MTNSPGASAKRVFSWKRLGSSPKKNAKRLRILIAACGVCVLGLGLYRITQIDGWMREVVVTGPSMQPTLWPASLQFACTRCGQTLRFHGLHVPPATRCWNCGAAQHPSGLMSLQGDRVYIDHAAYQWQLLGLHLPHSRPQRGDLVAVQQDSGLQVKRILAVPGDRLSLRGDELLINGRGVMESLPTPVPPLIVHTQSLPVADIAAAPRTESDSTHADSDADFDAAQRWRGAEDWLVYHHLSVYQQKPDRIRDDYPCNVDVARRMNGVERFGLTLQLQLLRPTTVTVQCWQAERPRCYETDLPAGTHRVHVDAQPRVGATCGAWQEVPCGEVVWVDAHRPLAVHGLQTATTGTLRLDVTRELHWFVDEFDRRHWTTNQRTLAPHRYFIAGDNQPISVDSRGAPAGVHLHTIIGKVIPR